MPGARPPAAPPRQRVDLAQVDTGYMLHNLYVKIVPAEDGSDNKSKELTKQVLLFITQRLPLLKQMGIRVNVNRIRSKDLKNQQLNLAMKRRGIVRLPALTTPNDVYLGLKEILEIYEKNIKEYEAYSRRGDASSHREMDLPENDLDEFYRSDMTIERAQKDADEEGIGDQDTETMMRSYSRMMQRRDKLNRDRKGYKPGSGGAADDAPPASSRPRQPAGQSRPPPVASSARPDNIHQEGDDSEITSLIDRINGELKGGDVDTAFKSGGGDSLADDEGGGGGDAADRFMEAAYWQNQEDSLK